MPSARPLTDHEEIRRWAEGRGATPACVKGTGKRGDTGMIRLDFPGFSGRESLQPIKWNEWFKQFDASGLALLVQDNTARGQKSNFNKLVSRETAQGAEGRRASRAGRGRKPSAARAAATGRTRRSSKPSSSNRTARQSNRTSGRRASKKTAGRTTARTRATGGSNRTTGRRASTKNARRTSTRKATAQR